MGSSKSSTAEGDQEALLYVLQMVLGVTVWLLVASNVADRLFGELLGFVAMFAAQFAFARKTWAAGVTAQQYWLSVVFGAAVLAGLRLVLE